MSAAANVISLTEGLTRSNMGRSRFYEILRDRRELKRGKNTVSLSREEYDLKVQTLKNIRAGLCKPSESDR